MIFPWAGFAWVSGLACGLFLLRLVEGVVVGFAYTFFLVVAFSLGVGFSFPGVVSLYVCGFLSLGFFLLVVWVAFLLFSWWFSCCRFLSWVWVFSSLLGFQFLAPSFVRVSVRAFSGLVLFFCFCQCFLGYMVFYFSYTLAYRQIKLYFVVQCNIVLGM